MYIVKIYIFDCHRLHLQIYKYKKTICKQLINIDIGCSAIVTAR